MATLNRMESLHRVASGTTGRDGPRGETATPVWYAPRRYWSPRARLAGLMTLAAVAAGAATRVYLVDPAEPGHYPSCPFRALTSLDCPGCGSTRGVHQALHGDLLAAADYNLLLVIVAPSLVIAWMVAVARASGWRGRLPQVPPRLLPAIPIVIIAFWIIRNLPFSGATWLAS